MSDEPAPVVRVVSGSPTDEELAALVVVLVAAASEASSGADRAAPPTAWSAHPARLRTAYGLGRGGWRGSVLPR